MTVLAEPKATLGEPRARRDPHRRAKVPGIRAVPPEAYIDDLVRYAGSERGLAARTSWGVVSEALAGFGRGGAVFCVSASQFSMIDLLVHVMGLMPKVADLSLWSYIAGNADGEALAGFWRRGEVKRLRVVFDESGLRLGNAPLYAGLQAEELVSGSASAMRSSAR